LQPSRQSYQDPTVFDTRFEGLLHDARVEAVLPGHHIKLPAMPRARHRSADELALSQRSALMRTDSVDRVNLTVDIENRHDPIARHAFL